MIGVIHLLGGWLRGPGVWAVPRETASQATLKRIDEQPATHQTIAEDGSYEATHQVSAPTNKARVYFGVLRGLFSKMRMGLKNYFFTLGKNGVWWGLDRFKHPASSL
jgi:hypothetical protein